MWLCGGGIIVTIMMLYTYDFIHIILYIHIIWSKTLITKTKNYPPNCSNLKGSIPYRVNTVISETCFNGKISMYNKFVPKLLVPIKEVGFSHFLNPSWTAKDHDSFPNVCKRTEECSRVNKSIRLTSIYFWPSSSQLFNFFSERQHSLSPQIHFCSISNGTNN